MADALKAKLERDIATLTRYITNLFGVRRRSTAQDAKLAGYLDRLARFQRALAAYQGAHPDLPDVVAIDIGPDPLPNNAQPPDTTYGCPDGFDEAVYIAKHGYSVQHGTDRAFTGLLRPNLDQIQSQVGRGIDQKMANWHKAQLVSKQRQAIDYAAGRIPFSAIAGLFGGGYGELGCNVRIAEIHDLGA